MTAFCTKPLTLRAVDLCCDQSAFVVVSLAKLHKARQLHANELAIRLVQIAGFSGRLSWGLFKTHRIDLSFSSSVKVLSFEPSSR